MANKLRFNFAEAYNNDVLLNTKLEDVDKMIKEHSDNNVEKEKLFEDLNNEYLELSNILLKYDVIRSHTVARMQIVHKGFKPTETNNSDTSDDDDVSSDEEKETKIPKKKVKETKEKDTNDAMCDKLKSSKKTTDETPAKKATTKKLLKQMKLKHLIHLILMLLNLKKQQQKKLVLKVQVLKKLQHH